MHSWTAITLMMLAAGTAWSAEDAPADSGRGEDAPTENSRAARPAAGRRAAAVPARRGVSWDGARLEDVISFLQQVTGANFVIDPAVDRTTPITLSVHDMSAENVLKWVCQLAGVTWVYQDEAIYIVPKGRALKRKRQPIVLDVRDLTMTMTDFPGPAFRLSNGPGFVELDDPVGGEVNQARVTTKEDIRRLLRLVIGEDAEDVVLEGKD